MRRRPSGSAIEESDGTLLPDASSTPEHVGQRRDSIGDTRRVIQKGSTYKRQSSESARKSSIAGESQAAASATAEKELLNHDPLVKDAASGNMAETNTRRRLRLRNPWSCSLLTIGTMALAAALLLMIAQSFLARQLDPNGCAMSYMRTSFVRYPDFDTEHTRFASKYSLYLYRELEIDEDTRVKGVPVLFIPGNAGSYKQVRSLASEAAYHFHNNIRNVADALKGGKRALDFFSVDFNEDITAFHGQTLLDQAEYLNDAVAYILSLYHNPNRSVRDPTLPDPCSVIIVGHSMGGIVARTMLTMPNYQANSVNTIVTLSAPHARPPVSFDADIVSTYKNVNDYWRHSYSQKWANDNPLWHVTLISIAGGGLDTVVPSDYASVASLVPDTHGFTVFTSTIPQVWTGMDHLAITWCDQLRKSVIRALYDIVDVGRPVQTHPRADRMRSFRRWLLTGLEPITEKTLAHQEPKTLLTLEDNSNAIISQGERLELRSFGQYRKPKAYLLPIPPQGALEGRKFTLLTDQALATPDDSGSLEVLFCSVFPLQAGQSATLFSMNMDLSGNSSGSTRLACKIAANDTIILPASTRESKYPFDGSRPFSYLEYDLEDLAEHQFVAVIDKAVDPTPGWVIAEFSASSESIVPCRTGLGKLITAGLRLKLPAVRPMAVDVKIPALHSSLLTYKLTIGQRTCGDDAELFTPLLRQYVSEVYESKFFVNVKEAEINLHGVAPYMPPPFRGKSDANGMSLQIWSDPTCESTMEFSLKVDLMGSMGKLWMRYRIVFASFPLVVVALVLRKQFKIYDETGIFMSFSQSMNQCLQTSLPVLFAALTFFGMSLASASETATTHWFNAWRTNATEGAVDYTKNDLLLGSQDTFFWFLVPMFGIICVGICIGVNYIALGITYIFTLVYGLIRSSPPRSEDGRRTPAAFAVTSTRQRIITTGILLLLVSTVIPYQFAYLVLCIVQVATCTRAWRLASETQLDANYNFYNYAHSLLILMLWILPINMPVLVVWIRNLAVHWLTPFSSHHNILSIMPYILLVETLSTGRMIPRVITRVRYFTNILLFVLSVYAAIYGATYAYLLHHIVNIICAWLVALHFTTSSFSFSRLDRLLDGAGVEGHHTKKRP